MSEFSYQLLIIIILGQGMGYTSLILSLVYFWFISGLVISGLVISGIISGIISGTRFPTIKPVNF